MAFYNTKPLPPGEYEGDPEMGVGWYFHHRATSEWIGPFTTKDDAQQAEAEHYGEPYAMPMWATYQS